MTVYEYYTYMKDHCLNMADCKDGNLKKFYLNAAKGFEIKQGNLTAAEAGVELW